MRKFEEVGRWSLELTDDFRLRVELQGKFQGDMFLDAGIESRLVDEFMLRLGAPSWVRIKALQMTAGRRT